MRKVFGVLSFILLTSASAAAHTQQPIRVKCGGPAYTDSKGQAWAADHGFNGGLVSKTTGPVSGTPDPALFQTGRTAPDSGSLIYTFPVTNGAYHVNLYSAELDSGNDSVGARVFNVLMQNNPTFQKVDIFAAVGANAPWIKGADITVTNGAVQLEFDTVAGADRAKVTAIEVLPAADNAPILVLNFVYQDRTPVVGTLKLYDHHLSVEPEREQSAGERPGDVHDLRHTPDDGPHRQRPAQPQPSRQRRAHAMADRHDAGFNERQSWRRAKLSAERRRAKNVASRPGALGNTPKRSDCAVLVAGVNTCGNRQSGIDILGASPYTGLVVRKPFCWTGGSCSLTIDTMCQNPFETIRLFEPEWSE